MPIDSHAARFLAMMGASKPLALTTLSQRRQGLHDLASVADAVPSALTRHDLSVDGPRGLINVRLYEPPLAVIDDVGIIYLHGGGWCAGGLATHDGVCGRLALASGFRVVAVDYRLAPEYPFPAGLEDTKAVLAMASQTFGFAADKIILAGDSAGATLATALACEASLVKIARLLLLCPILDVSALATSRVEYGEGYFVDSAVIAADLEGYLPIHVRADDPRVSPLHHPNLAALPPIHLHVAEFDPFRDEALNFAARVRQAGVKVYLTQHSGMIHYFYALARAVPYAQKAMAKAGAELREAMTGGDLQTHSEIKIITQLRVQQP